MKKILFFAALFILASFAKAELPANKITPCLYLQLSFENQFGPVKNVSWSQTINQLTRADFTQEGKSYAAYFDENNQYVSAVRVLDLSALSQETCMKVIKQLKGYAIVNMVEFWNEEMHVYFIEGRSKSQSHVFRLEASDVPDGLLTTAR